MRRSAEPGPRYEQLPGDRPRSGGRTATPWPPSTEPFGYRDGISHPAVEGSGVPGSNPLEQPLKAGEFVLGYPDELGGVQTTTPESSAATAATSPSASCTSTSPRSAASCGTTPPAPTTRNCSPPRSWAGGAAAPRSRCHPQHDDPELGADRGRNNAFLFGGDDPDGFTTPRGCHIRRANPRDSAVAGEPRLHRMIRRGTAYGPPLPDGVLDDDGADRGLMFAFVGAHLGRQFEFAQSQWINDGVFFGAGDARDPIAGTGDGPATTPSPAGPSARGCGPCRGSSPPAAASTPSCPASARCAGSASRPTDRAEATGHGRAASAAQRHHRHLHCGDHVRRRPRARP